ncbi:MAG: NAD-glutamate dehydrogenase [Gammaproteobacteria bacterium]
MTSKPLRRTSDQKDQFLEAIVAAVDGAGPFSDNDRLRSFLRHYYADVDVEDLRAATPANLAGAALAHLELGKTRRPGQHRLRIYNPKPDRDGWESTHTIVEMVNDNMPFLVDSIGMAVARMGATLHLTIHPLVRLSRDGRGRLTEIHPRSAGKGHVESFVRLEIDRETSDKRRAALKRAVEETLLDVRLAVRDWRKMRDRMLQAADELEAPAGRSDLTLLDESRRLLQWMADDHFTFLGYQEYEVERLDDEAQLRPVPGSGLGILSKQRSGERRVTMTPEMRRQARSRELLILTKANARSTVHRPSHLDYIGVKLFDEKGEPVGEKRFLGLFTSVAYNESPRAIPLLRLKVHRVLERAALDPSGHRGKALMHVLDTYPRDELFQSTVQDLSRTTSGILNLQERQRVKLFLRRDAFRRFFSCLVFVPREKYNTRVRQSIEAILMQAFDGISIESSVELSESVLARLHLIVRTQRGRQSKISIRQIERDIAAAVVTWQDRLGAALITRLGEARGIALHRRYGHVFPLAYEEDISPASACGDVETLDSLISGEASAGDDTELYRPPGVTDRLHFKIFRAGEPLALSDALPILENLGVRVVSERPYHLELDDGSSWWLQDFELEHPRGAAINPDEAERRFEDAFGRVMAGNCENDGLNRLVLDAGLSARETSVLRALSKYLLQLGLPFSQPYMESVLARHPRIAALFVRQFRLQFDPDLERSTADAELEQCHHDISKRLTAATTLDEDRILRAYAGVLDAALRTSFFCTDEDGRDRAAIAIKFDPSALEEAPLPRPRYEIFVYSPRVEGTHLRAGSVARGGIRWSDRREDFRTEVLGLMKAQTVKNTVIVPTGAKGGFVPKRLPEGDRDVVQREVIACYRIFIGSLLDVTDNIVDGRVVTPSRVLRRDGDDPYLVVAADKGTAAFSDIANSISADYGFWLGDAFASGGSAGYDHKKMGITARGAWEAVRRHFRELGLDTQSEPFTVVGIGDMSGDVFGNGMLLSEHIRLLAAFNHQHIFLDPDPDPATGFAERRRLFDLPRSTWEDYDKRLISAGGGVYSRSAKRIRLSRQVRAMLGVEQENLSPPELIRAILRTECDLLWNGGIGTYVKAAAESHTEVGDRSNDAVRIDAHRLRCRVVGEGGNLGLTQRARIEYALAGGRINTDFIDNSGGVDSSDREVNIKILLSDVARHRRMSVTRRNRLLADMTEDVAALVLRNNYLQTQAISMMQATGVERMSEQMYLVQALEKHGILDRELEYLPEDEVLEERRQQGHGLTRPELAVLLSYAKIDLYARLQAAGIPTDGYLARELAQYFPPPLPRRYAEFISRHRLAGDILATLITNSMVNRMGPAFAWRAADETGADVVTVARSYAIAREVCSAREIWSGIEELDNRVPAETQYLVMFEVGRKLRHACYWLLRRCPPGESIESTVETMKPGVSLIFQKLPALLSEQARTRLAQMTEEFEAMGLPGRLAQRVAALTATTSALDIVDIAAERDVRRVARLYFELGRGLRLDWVREKVDELRVRGHWQALARGRLRDNIRDTQRNLTVRIMRETSADVPAADAVLSWLDVAGERVSTARQMLDEMQKSARIDFATLSVATDELRLLTDR